MAQNWDYAELSKAAKAAGGPEKYVELIEKISRDDGKREMLPWLGLTAGLAAGLTAVTIKLINYFKSKRAKKQDAIEEAKKEIIDGIKEYDAVHDE